MIELGILGLDTSHGERFAEYIETLPDVSISAVWDGGSIRDDEYVRDFCADYDAARTTRATSMMGLDGVMVLTVNWDDHVALAEPYLDAGMPVLVDKPLAGSMEDLERLTAAASDARLFGGSALPFHPAFARLPTKVPDRSLFCAGYDDAFYYGAHLTDLVSVLTDAQWLSVTPCERARQTVGVELDDGSFAVLSLDGPAADSSFGVLDVSTQVYTARVESSETAHETMYTAYLDVFLDVLRGEWDPTARLLNGAELLLAVNAALRSECVITRTSPELAEIDVDGGAFAASYEPYY